MSVPTPGLILVHYRDSGKKRHEGLCRISRRKRTRRRVSDVGVPATDRPRAVRPIAGLAWPAGTLQSLVWSLTLRKRKTIFALADRHRRRRWRWRWQGDSSEKRLATRFSARGNSPSIRSASGMSPLSEGDAARDIINHVRPPRVRSDPADFPPTPGSRDGGSHLQCSDL